MTISPETILTAFAGAYAIFERFNTRKQIQHQTDLQTVTIVAAIAEIQRNVISEEVNNKQFRAEIKALNLVPNLSVKVDAAIAESLSDRNSLRERIVVIENAVQELEDAISFLKSKLEDCKRASGEVSNV